MKNFEGQASEVIGHLVKLSSVLRSLENLGKIERAFKKLRVFSAKCPILKRVKFWLILVAVGVFNVEKKIG
jgi:hypothetical protein